MPQKVRIALDAMGGDVGASVVIPGAAISLKRHPDSEFLLYGDSADRRAACQISGAEKGLPRGPYRRDRQHARQAEQALRRGRKNSSMWLAIDAVKKGEADVAVSAGNTGALMAMARFHLHTMPGIDRPAIAGVWPTARGDSVVLDLGASIGGDAHHLVSLAVMGSAMASVLFGLKRPTVGPAQYRGRGGQGRRGDPQVGTAPHDEPARTRLYRLRRGRRDRRGRGRRDRRKVSGNIALKAAEGTARQMADFLRNAMASSWQSKIGYLFARSAFKALRDKLDPNKSNGGVLLGLKGVVVKSHGGINAEGFAYAVDVGYEMVRCDLLTKISALVAGADRAGGCVVTAIRSVVLGCGSCLPEDC